MATVVITGAEWNTGDDKDLETPSGGSIGLPPTATQVRSGSYAWTMSGLSSGSNTNSFTAAPCFAQVYVYLTSYPGSATTLWIARLDNLGTTIAEVRLASDGTITLWAGDTLAQVGSASSALTQNQWIRLELAAASGAGTGYAELRIDGTTLASSSALTITNNPANFKYGITAVSGVNYPASSTYFDDIVVNDNTGSNNSWPDGAKVVLLLPISDNSRTNWTAGDGAGTTNLYAAIDNRGPTRVASANETTTTNIESASNTGTANYSANLTTYSSAGIASADTVLAVAGHILHAEDATTGTKTGSVELTSNPVISAVTFNFGNNIGAHLTGSTNYLGAWTAYSQLPSVTLGSSPVLKVIKTDTTTRTGCVFAAGAYVAYLPAPADRAPLPTYNRRVIQAVNRASVY